jgi:hypothetical protein
MAVLGVMAKRFNTLIEFDAANMKVTNHPNLMHTLKNPYATDGHTGEPLVVEFVIFIRTGKTWKKVTSSSGYHFLLLSFNFSSNFFLFLSYPIPLFYIYFLLVINGHHVQ